MLHYSPRSYTRVLSSTKARTNRHSGRLRRLPLVLTALGIVIYIGALLHYRSTPSLGSGTQTSLDSEPVADSLGTVDTESINSRKGSSTRQTKLARTLLRNQQAQDVRSTPQSPVVASPKPVVNRTLRFQVCNGFANQRLSIVYGALLARRTGRALVLPHLIAAGSQASDEQVHEGNSTGSLPFEAVYLQQPLIDALAKHGVVVLSEQEAPPPERYTTRVSLEQGPGVQALLSPPASSDPQVAIDCPLFKLWPGMLDAADTPLAWAVLTALQPSEGVRRAAERPLRALQSRGGAPSSSSGVFNALHLRFERDWLAHCNRWEHIHDGIVRDNCLNNTHTLGPFLKLMGVETGVPLYVASYWADVEPGLNTTVMQSLSDAGYQVVTSLSLLGGALASGSAGVGREQLAQIDYIIALAAHRFIGNSVSTFSALAILERRHSGQWAAYYNGGNLPLATMLPGLHKMPWVFTYNNYSEKYDHMLKAAVLSAGVHGTLQPHCLFMGDTRAPIYDWLESRGVKMVAQAPKWREALVQQAGRRDNTFYSPLYKSPDLLVSTFQRLDIAVTPELTQYTYVLFTDADVYFRTGITLDDFGLPLPRSVSMSYEFRPDEYPYNAGVMLMHLPELRRTYHDFLKFILSNDKGLHFGAYGPADQGAYNQFYEKELKARMLNQKFNTKPYNGLSPGASVVHFHGPKPRDYLTYVEKGTCDGFFWICESALSTSLCTYLPEWVRFVVKAEPPESRHVKEAQRLLDACLWLGRQEATPTWSGVEGPTETLRTHHARKWPKRPPVIVEEVAADTLQQQ